jgi:hypothetical protein
LGVAVSGAYLRAGDATVTETLLSFSSFFPIHLITLYVFTFITFALNDLVVVARAQRTPKQKEIPVTRRQAEPSPSVVLED